MWGDDQQNVVVSFIIFLFLILCKKSVMFLFLFFVLCCIVNENYFFMFAKDATAQHTLKEFMWYNNIPVWRNIVLFVKCFASLRHNTAFVPSFVCVFFLGNLLCKCVCVCIYVSVSVYVCMWFSLIQNYIQTGNALWFSYRFITSTNLNKMKNDLKPTEQQMKSLVIMNGWIWQKNENSFNQHR